MDPNILLPHPAWKHCMFAFHENEKKKKGLNAGNLYFPIPYFSFRILKKLVILFLKLNVS